MATGASSGATTGGAARTPNARLLDQFRRRTELEEVVSVCRSAVGTIALFSLGINLLYLAPPLYMLQVYDRVLSSGNLDTLITLTVVAAAALILLGALDSLRAAVTGRIGRWFSERLGPAYLANGVRLRLQGDGAGSQSLRDLSHIQGFIGSPGLTVFFDMPWVPVFVGLIWLQHPVLGVLALGAVVVLLAVTIATELLTRKPSLSANVTQISAHQHAEAIVRNAETVRAMGMLPAVTERWRRVNGEALDASETVSLRSGALSGLTKSIRLLLQIAVIGLGAVLVLRGELTPGAMIASSILLGRALAPLDQAMGAWRNFSAARFGYTRLKARMESLPAEPERIRLPTPVGGLTVDRLTYTPPGARHRVLLSISFSTEPGQATAVIGPSASGKSTLCRLLLGLAVPNAGQVRLDGADVAHWDPEQLGRHIGYLPQAVELFSGTVRENIARMVEAGDDEVIAAAKLAHVHDMIQQLPEGYETQLGDGGAPLSAGQRQRIGLARAVFGDPRLVILDEPNSNLDQSGESALAAAIEALKQRGAAVIVVGHRPSTLAQADLILLLKEGRVNAFGPRDEVLRKLREASAATLKPADTGPIATAPGAPPPDAPIKDTADSDVVDTEQRHHAAGP